MHGNRPLSNAEIEARAPKLVADGTAPHLGAAREMLAIGSGRIDGDTRLLDSKGKLIRERPGDPEWLRAATA